MARSPAQIGVANGRKSSTSNAESCQEKLFLRLCISGDTRSAACPWAQWPRLSPAVLQLWCSHRNTERLQVFEHLFCSDVAHSQRLRPNSLIPDRAPAKVPFWRHVAARAPSRQRATGLGSLPSPAPG
jgi:hypothetical protein